MVGRVPVVVDGVFNSLSGLVAVVVETESTGDGAEDDDGELLFLSMHPWLELGFVFSVVDNGGTTTKLLRLDFFESN